MDKNGDENETLTLIFNENRINVEKKKLIHKSRYFASLYLHNFSDSNKTEHIVNYDFPLVTLKNFIEWVHDEQESSELNVHNIKISLSKFFHADFAELCNLLHISIIYGAPTLMEDLTDILIIHWLLPKRLLDIWLMAQDLGLNVLRDICFSMCLDLFEDLPLASLIELPKKYFYALVRNINIRSSSAYLELVQKEWAMYHGESDISTKNERRPKFLDGVIVSNLSENTTNRMYMYVWDGHNLNPVAKLKDISDSRKEIVGMQVIGRGFTVYIVGGEMGLGTGRFNQIIWRYSLISKKWYYHARLPVPRRHMIAVFIKNKLVIVGGVGRHRIKLDRVDLLNIHTGEWTDGERMQDDFTEVPAHCVENGKLYVIRMALHIYDPELNLWTKVPLSGSALVTNCAVFANNKTLFFLGEDDSGETILSRINPTDNSPSEKEECLQTCKEHMVYKDLPIYQANQSCLLRSVNYRDHVIALLETPDFVHTNLHLHVLRKPDLAHCNINPKLGCFRVIDPSTLYDTI